MANYGAVSAFCILCFAGHQMVLCEFQSASSKSIYRSAIAYTGSVFMSFLPVSNVWFWLMPFSYVTANRKASCGSSLGWVHNFRCTILLFMFCMNVSMIRLSVCSPNALFEAIPVKVCQNFRNVIFWVCFLEKNLYRSNVLFRDFTKACSLFCFISSSDIVATHMCGNLSVRLFLAADPSDSKSTLTIFLSAACSFTLLMSAATRGCCSVTVLRISFTEIEYFAFAATMKRSHHSSHSYIRRIPEWWQSRHSWRSPRLCWFSADGQFSQRHVRGLE